MAASYLSDRTAIQGIHEDYAENGLLTATACKMAAHDVAEFNEALALFLVERANEMDRPVTISDIMASVDMWSAR